MTLHLRAAIVLMGFALAAPHAAPPATAQAAPSADAEEITLTFRPPLDQPLRYRVAQSRDRPDRPPEAADWVEELRFTREGEAWVLHWRIDPKSLPASAGPALPLFAPFTGEPLAFDLDAEGEVLRARDWASVRPRLLALVDGITRGQSAKDAAALAPLRSMFESITAEQAPALLLKSIQPMLGWGGMSMQVGETHELADTVMVPVFQVPVERRTSITLEPPVAGAAGPVRFRLHSEVSGESLRKMITDIAGQMGVALDSPKGREMEAQLSQIASGMADEVTVAFDRDTALPRHLRTDRRARMGDKTLLQTLEVTRID